MPVGKESIKRAASAGTTGAKKKTTTRKPAAKKAAAEKAAPETAVQETVVQETVLVPDEQVAKFVVEGKKEGPVRITEDLPVYLL